MPVMQEAQETQVQSLGWEDPLAKEMDTHSSILTWRIPWTEEPGGLRSPGSQRVGHDGATEHSSSKVPKEAFNPQSFSPSGSRKESLQLWKT